MRKNFIIAMLIILLTGTASAEVEVLFLPESSFLRVHGEITMEPSSFNPSFILFPTAQITELWTDDLIEYNVQTGPHSIMVSLSLRQIRPQLLSFSYEGFLNQNNQEFNLNRDSLWFPEFAFPISEPTFTIEISPSHWEISEQKNTLDIYPTFIVRNSQIDESENDPDTLDTIPEVPVVDQFTSRIKMQVTRLTNAINQRNVTELKALMNPKLKESGLAQFLVDLPLPYGTLGAELVDPFTIVFSTETGFQYVASVFWQEREGKLELQDFTLRPSGLEIPDQLLSSFNNFARELYLATQIKDRRQLLTFLDDELSQNQGEIVEFLVNLNLNSTSTMPWTVEYATLDPLTITILAPYTQEIKFLLFMGLTPGENNWLIEHLDIVPIS